MATRRLASSGTVLMGASGRSRAKTGTGKRNARKTREGAGATTCSEQCGVEKNCQECSECTELRSAISAFFDQPPIVLATEGSRRSWGFIKEQFMAAVEGLAMIPENLFVDLERMVASLHSTRLYQCVQNYTAWLQKQTAERRVKAA